MDILTLIENRKDPKPETRLVRRWVIMRQGRMARGARLYTYAKVRALVARANRLGLDCYAAPLMVRL